MPIRRIHGGKVDGIKYELDLQRKTITFSVDENLSEETREKVKAFGELMVDSSTEFHWEVPEQGVKVPPKPTIGTPVRRVEEKS